MTTDLQGSFLVVFALLNFSKIVNVNTVSNLTFNHSIIDLYKH